MINFIFSLFEGRDRRALNKYIVLSFISPAMDIFGLSMVLVIMNRIMDEGGASDTLIKIAFSMAAFSLVKGLFELYKTNMSNRIIYDGSRKVSILVYDLVMKEELKDHNDKTPMQALNLVKEDTQTAIGILIKAIGIMVSVVTLVGYSVALIWYGRLAGIIILTVLLIMMVAMYLLNRRHVRVYGDLRRQLTIRSNAQVTTAYGAFKEMKIDNRADYLVRRYADTSRELARVQAHFSLRNSVANVLMSESIMVVLFIFLGFLMLYNSDIVSTLSSMIIYVGILIKMVPGMYGIIGNLNGIDFAHKSYDALKDCMTRYKEIQQTEKTRENMREKHVTLNEGIAVRGLTFGYRPDKKIFDNADITIPASSSVAIIGASGTGKTTFLDLILGLLKAESGTVYYDDYEIVNGSDGNGVCKGNLGDVVSYIPQIVYLNGETVKHNVAFFEEDDRIDSDKIIECLKIAQIWDDVREMPNGIDTEIGPNGTIISGGQRQRIALARALYKEFEILIMDEATAALDMETEKAVIDSIRQVKGNKTLLMVTHHMSLANECDIIYKIENKGFTRQK